MALTDAGVSALGSVGGATISAGAQWASAKSVAKESFKYSKKLSRVLAKKGPTWQMKGLEAAGLNPILAAGGSWGGPSAAHVAAAQPDFSELSKTVSSALAARNLAEQNRLLGAQADSAEANAKVDAAVSEYLRKHGQITGPSGATAFEKPLYQQQIDAEIARMTSAAEASSWRAQLDRAAVDAGVPRAQVLEIENAIRNRNLDDAKKLMIESGVKGVQSILNAVRR